jgi:hypothetical protein
VIKLLQVDEPLCEVVEWVERGLSFSCGAHLLLHDVVIVSVVSNRLSGVEVALYHIELDQACNRHLLVTVLIQRHGLDTVEVTLERIRLPPVLCTLALLALVNLHLYFLRLIGKSLVGVHHRLRLYELLGLLRLWIKAVFMRSNRAFSGMLTGCAWNTSKE